MLSNVRFFFKKKNLGENDLGYSRPTHWIRESMAKSSLAN